MPDSSSQILPAYQRGESRAHRQPIAQECQSHRGVEIAEVGIEMVAFLAHDHQLAGLIVGHKERQPQLTQQSRKALGVDAPQRRALRTFARRGRLSRKFRHD
jgi:hypothetical protein